MQTDSNNGPVPGEADPRRRRRRPRGDRGRRLRRCEDCPRVQGARDPLQAGGPEDVLPPRHNGGQGRGGAR